MTEGQRGGVIEGERQKAKGKSADEEPDFGAEDHGRYRHPETVACLPYAFLEAKVLDAIDRNIRTVARIKDDIGIDRGVDISPVISGMELDRKIRVESNGTLSALFLFDQMPSKFWNNGDGTIGAEFIEGWTPPAVLDGRLEERLRGDYNKPEQIQKRKDQRKRDYKINIDGDQLEELAATLPSIAAVAQELGYSTAEGLRQRLIAQPELKPRMDAGRLRFAAERHPKQDLPEPVQPAPIKSEKEKTMSAAATATAPEKAEYTPQEMEALALEHGTPGRVAKALGCTHHTQISNLLRNRPELKAAFDRGVAAYRIANPIDDPKPREARAERRKAKPTPPPTPASMNAGSSAEIGTTPQEDEEMSRVPGFDYTVSKEPPAEELSPESKVESPKSESAERKPKAVPVPIKATVTRKIGKNGVHFFGFDYYCDELAPYKGVEVEAALNAGGESATVHLPDGKVVLALPQNPSEEIQKRQLEDRKAPISDRIRELAGGEDREKRAKRSLLDDIMLPSLLGSFMRQPRRVGLQRVVEFEGGNLVVAFDGNLFDLSQDERAFVNKIVDRCEQQPAVEPRRRRTWFGRFVDRFKL